MRPERRQDIGFLISIFSLAVVSLSSAFAPVPNLLIASSSLSLSSTGTLVAMISANNNKEESGEMNEGGEDVRTPKLISGWGDEDDNDDQDSNKQEEGNVVADDPLFDEYCSVLDDFGCEAYEDLAKNLDEKVYRWIRVEAREDETLTEINSKMDIVNRIEQVRSLQNTYGRSDLYERKWQDCTTRPEPVNGDRPPSFSVLQFNALAEGLSSGPNVKTPFRIKEEIESNKPNDPGYGGFTQVPVPEICLDFNVRRWRLLEVILGFSSIHPNNNDKINNNHEPLEGIFDILALEEIDRFRGFFAPVLRIFGYEGLFMPKSKAPGVQLGYYSDGCALFWKTETFELVSEERIKYKLGNQVIILAEFKHKSSGCLMLVAVTHLKAQKSETNEKIRRMQVEELLRHVETAVRKCRAERGIKDIPVLIMGDFNADPPAHITFPDSSIRRVLDNHHQQQQMTTGEDDSSNNNNQQQPPLKFQSAYPIDPPEEGFYTTWKTRGTHTVRRIIDYIFHSEAMLTCTARLSVPKEEELEESRLPGLRYPSDHLMVAAKYDIVQDK